jgi:hypothetical protein
VNRGIGCRVRRYQRVCYCICRLLHRSIDSMSSWVGAIGQRLPSLAGCQPWHWSVAVRLAADRSPSSRQYCRPQDFAMRKSPGKELARDGPGPCSFPSSGHRFCYQSLVKPSNRRVTLCIDAGAFDTRATENAPFPDRRQSGKGPASRRSVHAPARPPKDCNGAAHRHKSQKARSPTHERHLGSWVPFGRHLGDWDLYRREREYYKGRAAARTRFPILVLEIPSELAEHRSPTGEVCASTV